MDEQTRAVDDEFGKEIKSLIDGFENNNTENDRISEKMDRADENSLSGFCVK